MPHYRYQALDDSQRSISGECEAETVSQAISALAVRGLVVQSIVRVSAESLSMGLPSQQDFSGKLALPAAAPTELGRQELQSLLTKAFTQGAEVTPILRAYAQDILPPSQRQELEEVVRILETSDLEKALGGFRDHAQWWLPLLGAMEKASTPGALLERFVLRVGPARERRRQWWLALAYPLLLAGLILAVLTILSLLVVPTFQLVFDSFGIAIPFSTKTFLALSVWVRSWWVFLLFSLIAICLALIVLARVRPAVERQLVSRALARLPSAVTPRRWRSLWIGRFTAYLADLLEAGTTIPGALRVAALAVERPAISAAARRFADAIECDWFVHDASVSERLSATVVYAVQTPCEPSAQIQLLREISLCQLEQATSRGGMSAALGPISVVVIGLIIGWMVLAMFAPLVTLISALSG